MEIEVRGTLHHVPKGSQFPVVHNSLKLHQLQETTVEE